MRPPQDNADVPAPWISASFLNSSIYARLRVMIDEERIAYDTEEDIAALAKLTTRYLAGDDLSEHELPRRFCGTERSTRIKSMPDFSYANGFFVVSEACADVFRQFDLGTGGFHPVTILQGNRKTPVEGSFFVLKFGCRTRAFVEAESNLAHMGGLGPNGLTQAPWMALGYTEDNDCAVSQVALEGPDLWIDPDVRHAFFLSDRLLQGLKAAKMTRRIRHKRCRVC